MEKNKAIRRTTQIRENGGPRHTYIFKCSIEQCQKEIKVRSDALKKASGKCKTHNKMKRPFESIYNGLFQDHRKIPVYLTYDEFIEFTKIKNCHYCDAIINWIPYGQIDGVFKSRAYFLDRKYSDKPYSKENCVVCCTLCNRMKKAMSIDDFIKFCKTVALKFS